MMGEFRITTLLLAMLLGCAAATLIVGIWALGLGMVILVLLAVRMLGGAPGASWWGWAASLLGLLGGMVAMVSAATALERSAGGARAGFGWAALALAATAATAATLARARPRMAAIGLVAGSALGMAAISLFDINTLYLAALPLCWIAATAALLGRRPEA